MKRILIFGLVAIITALGVAHAAPAGRVVVLCGPNVEWCDAVKAHFPKDTGIAIDFVRMSANESLARLRAERTNPIFDVWFGGTGDPHLVAAIEGITEFYKPKAWNDLRPELRDAVGGRYIPLYAGILGWAINGRLLREKNLPEPKTWADLADPRYKGLIAYANPNTSGTAYNMLATMVQVYGEEKTFDILKRVHRNVAEYTQAGAAPATLAGRGEVAIGVVFVHDAIAAILAGFPLTYGASRDGTGFEIGGLSLVKGATNRANAITFIDWALTPEAQALAASEGKSLQIPSNAKTPVPSTAPRFQDFKMIKYDFVKFGTPAVHDALLKRWTTEVFPLPK
jgi:iron(III) transport system substrate-binding protein